MICTRCCEDLDIKLEDLIFPERMSPEGLAFCEVHGLWDVSLGELQDGAMDLGDGRVKLQHLCRQLMTDGRCAIYETRPTICREFRCDKHAERFPEEAER